MDGTHSGGVMRAEGEAKRLPADFIVGAHALLRADRWMTLAPARSKQDFPELRLFELTPEA